MPSVNPSNLIIKEWKLGAKLGAKGGLSCDLSTVSCNSVVYNDNIIVK